MKKPIILIVLSLLSICASAQVANVISRSTLFDGSVYNFTAGRIKDSDIPRWTEKSKSPSLTPWDAAEKATAFMSKVPTREKMAWDLGSITLHRYTHNPERWLYKIRFREDPAGRGSYDGFTQSFEVIVLMNGEIPTPVITKKK